MFANIIVDISHEKLDRPFGYIIPKELEDKIIIFKISINKPPFFKLFPKFEIKYIFEN